MISGILCKLRFLYPQINNVSVSRGGISVQNEFHQDCSPFQLASFQSGWHINIRTTEVNNDDVYMRIACLKGELENKTKTRSPDTCSWQYLHMKKNSDIKLSLHLGINSSSSYLHHVVNKMLNPLSLVLDCIKQRREKHKHYISSIRSYRFTIKFQRCKRLAWTNELAATVIIVKVLSNY